MTISIFTTITRPDYYQYAWKEAIESYCALADEVVIICGHESDIEKVADLKNDKIKYSYLPWPETWHWEELPKHLNRGLDLCTGDWCIKMDIDYVLHEKDMPKIRKSLEDFLPSPHIYALNFLKFTILEKNKGYEKAIMPLCIRRSVRGIVRYGVATDQKTDWCYPVLLDTNHGFGKNEIPEGIKLPHDHTIDFGIDIYNYDYFFRTKEIARAEFWRFAKAYATAFDKSWGINEERSWEIFISRRKGQLTNPYIKPVDHPKFIKERIKKMTSDELGYNNWNNYEGICL